MVEQILYMSLLISSVGMILKFYRFKKGGQFLNVPENRECTRHFFNFKALILNTILQIKLYKAGKIRWGCHFLLLVGFLYLVIVHALHDITASFLFNAYDPTVDPFLILRNIAGVLVLAACTVFMIRKRFKQRLHKDKSTSSAGFFSVLLIASIVGSGFFLEASKIISEPVFMEMVDAYSDLDAGTDLQDLKYFWKTNYHVVFSENIEKQGIEGDANRIKNGRMLNEAYCLSCHSPVQSAFLSTALAKIAMNAAPLLNRYRSDTVLYAIHYGLCMLLLVSLPFSSLFHVLLIPFSSSRRHLSMKQFSEDRATIDTASLYACTQCGYCSTVCSVYPNFQISGNPDILPHSKISSIITMLEKSSTWDLWQLHTGNHECTHCHNCTDICPSGIDLQSLWAVLDKKFLTLSYADNHHFIKQTPVTEWVEKETITLKANPVHEITSDLTDKTDAFENCIQCTICTTVCPIVEYDSTQNDMTPHQVMNLLRLGKKHLATGTRMVWTCLTCYACQEQCPQEIRVTDILLELRNSGSMSAEMIKIPFVYDQG